MDPDAVELRVLGCLIEKQRTTPDQYPLSLNALRLACNQSTNRDPVADYDEQTIRGALTRLSNRGWVRLASGPGSRAVKYRHLADEALALSDDDLSLLAVLMLRGPQTPGELKQRTERLHPFASLAEVEATLERLVERELVARLPRQPGQKEVRYRQRLGGDGDGTPTTETEEPAPNLEARIEALEERVRRLEQHTGVQPL
ncbi:MAG TPA: YceH family protein [Gaiellaceae bacterium]|nr:YceH family protein [Gaiellaceae bacterium]